MKAYVFPGQGSQYPGMAKDLYDKYDLAKTMFKKAEEILGFKISNYMFNGTEEDLKQTKITQPSIFLHSLILVELIKDFDPSMVAGHSLGEISALVAAKCITFEEGIYLVAKRSEAMQKACELNPSTMAAILGLSDEIVENICKEIENVVPANYNCPGQIVISGTHEAIDKAIEKFSSLGAKRAIKLAVGGAFHSPLMEYAKKQFEKAVDEIKFKNPICPIYQNVSAKAEKDPQVIKENLKLQLTSPVKWTQSIIQMINDGAKEFIEIGPGKVLQGLIKKIDNKVNVTGISTL